MYLHTDIHVLQCTHTHIYIQTVNIVSGVCDEKMLLTLWLSLVFQPGETSEDKERQKSICDDETWLSDSWPFIYRRTIKHNVKRQKHRSWWANICRVIQTREACRSPRLSLACVEDSSVIYKYKYIHIDIQDLEQRVEQFSVCVQAISRQPDLRKLLSFQLSYETNEIQRVH